MASTSLSCMIIFIVTLCINSIIADGPFGFPIEYTQPEQIHLAYGKTPNIMRVSWVTFSKTTNVSMVQYGNQPLNLKSSSPAVVREWIDVNVLRTKRYMYLAEMVVTPGKAFFYRVGSMNGWSSVYYFVAQRDDRDWQPIGIVYGDMGNTNAQSLGRIQTHAQKLEIDNVFHIGDFGYDMYEYDSQRGDQFFRQIEPAAAYVPYMSCPGNHEMFANFSNYRHRFDMPGGSNNSIFHAFNWGPVRIIMFSTEVYFFNGLNEIETQYRWLEEQLSQANSDEARQERPWIITMAHRPMYCSNTDHDDCTNRESIIRTGLLLTHKFALEPLFYKYGVDVMYWAHEHSYERLLPVYNRTLPRAVHPDDPYNNPGAPVHIITGSAGCREDHSAFLAKEMPWDAVRDTNYGFAIMQALNDTHLHIQQLKDSDGSVVDDLWIKKTWKNHKPTWLQGSALI